MNSYIFTSERLGFRNWVAADIPKMVKINASQEVMQHFPSTATAQQTADFIKRMQIQYTEKGYCYFAVDRLSDGNFIGFIGLSYQTFEADFTPCVDVGWRLDYHVITPGLKESAQAVSVYREQRFSDHAPVIMDFDLS